MRKSRGKLWVRVKSGLNGLRLSERWSFCDSPAVAGDGTNPACVVK